MPLQCTQCGEPVSCRAGERLPPWCPGRGADIRPYTAEQQSAPSPSLPEPQAPDPEPHEGMPTDIAAMGDVSNCPACLLALNKPEGHEDCVISCPECGQCLRVPASWAPAAQASQRKLGASAVPAREKLPGWFSLLL